MPSSKKNEFSKLEQLKNEGKFKEASALLNELEREKGLLLQDHLEIHHLKSFLLIELGDINEALKYAKLAYKESLQLKNKFKIVDILFTMRKAFVMDGRENKALETIIKAEKILNTINQTSSLEFKEKIGYLNLNKSRYYFDMGDFNRSLTHADEVLAIAKEIKNKKLMMFTARIFALNYALKGNHDRAHEYRKKYLTLASELNDKQETISALYIIGTSLIEKGDFDQALVYLEQSLSLCDEINSWKKIPVLSNLCELYINTNSFDKAQKCLNQMKQFRDQTNFKISNSFYSLTKAMILKSKSQEIDLLKAKQILKQIVDEERPFVGLLYPALVELCDLYLLDLFKTNNLKALDEIQPIISKLMDIAKDQKSFWLLVEVYSLKAKLKLMTFEFEEAQNLLRQSMDIAKKHSLIHIAQRISSEQDELQNQKNKWETLRRSKALMAERMDLARVDEQIVRMLRKRVYLEKKLNLGDFI
ncbi:MAG: tetratricopeptide repeat protein [Candidatus Odinarchaeota archaeon]